MAAFSTTASIRAAALSLTLGLAVLVFVPGPRSISESIIGPPTAAVAQEPLRNTRRAEARLCWNWIRRFGLAVKRVAQTHNVERARVLRYRASLKCRAGRQGEAQLLLEAALIALNQAPQHTDLIDRAIANRAARDARERRLEELFGDIGPPLDLSK